MKKLNVNGASYKVDADETTPLLWIIREQLGMTGTKYGCGIAQCGSCTVHIDGNPVRSCVMPLAAVSEKNEITNSRRQRRQTLKNIQITKLVDKLKLDKYAYV